ncbi:AraC family transcriptional regulator [Pseudomonas sp. N040]|uniref:AraC family transcriptional regulator n=1 Tax=Pseudomonas sp. N040 TaxID=2785325 RepID=UPI0018A2EEF0|nr:AraC family transcriptional regulator [Pseudomonas sp. N040]MBF7729026.1 AraC family transcriptional regulator [Pseudomonas sp. N040]MBW7012666.1 AraC family transcriptional regulator [Pseudomonas sp. N040]
MTTLVRAAVLTKYFGVARQVGLNPQPLLRRLGLTQAMLENPDQLLAADTAVTLLEESARESGCSTFGLRMAEARQMADFGPVSLLLNHQRTLREALQTTVQYRHLLNEALALFIEEVGKTVIVREEVVTDRPIPARQATDLALGALFRLCSGLLGQNWHPLSVNFTYEAVPDQQDYRRLFGCKLEFGSEFNGFIFSAIDLDKPNPLADPVMARHAERFIDSLPGVSEHSLVLDVRKAIYILLPMGRATIEQVAQAQGINLRTLQRRLEEEGVTFSELINEVRRDLVLRYMGNPRYSLGRIAELLGYSVPSSFTRWFTTQFGLAPAAWRQEWRKRGSSVEGRE